MIDVGAAQRHCEAITRREAANFYYGIRLLPAAKRTGMCAIYAFARRVDDVGDGDLPSEDKLRRLEDERQAVRSIGEPGVVDPVMVALADAQARFGLPVDSLADLIDGVGMDVTGDRYQRFEDLVVYCRRVAGSIGRLSLAVFGSNERETAAALADDLGVAMQLTNILRDIREDAERGRVYLPAEDLSKYGWAAGEGDAVAAVTALSRSTNGSAPAGVAELVRFEAERGRAWFHRGLGLVPLLDRRSAACVLAMTGIYRRLLDRIEAHPEQVLDRRVSLPAWEKAWVAARSMIGAEA
jgi:phytoene synthase